ncbi:MAG: exonuclease SbcCD subunit D [Spirochaetota bacterium]
MPTFVHISDTHLGFSDFDKVNESGINQREADVYTAFATVVDEIIIRKPDFVLHTGDLFHRASPSNRALVQGLSLIKKITKAGIPFIVIAGNHSTPKTVYTSPILQALQNIEGVYAVYNQQYEYISLDGIHFHCLPHVHDDREYTLQIEKINPQNGHNILLMHTSLGKDYLLDEYGERLFPESGYHMLKSFDYVALGHWHNFQVLPQWSNACYCGSTERFSDREASKQKGFVTVTIGTNTTVEFTAIPIRPWLRFDVTQCSERSTEDIKKCIQDFAGKSTDGAIVSIYLHDLDTHQSAAISNMWIANQFSSALVILPKRIFKKKEGKSFGYREQISIEDLFVEYCTSQIADEDERKAIAGIGKKYIRQYLDALTDVKD